MSGKLNVSELDRFFEMYFDEGEAVHARSAHATSEAGGQLEGLDALLDLFCWDAGAYNFQPGVITKTRTIKEGLQGVLMEGAMLKDYRSYLKKLNLTRKSVLSVTKENCEISPEQLSKVLNNGIDVNLEIQKTIFQDLKVPKSLDKLIENHKLNRLVWIPIVFNLLNLKLVEIVHAS